MSCKRVIALCLLSVMALRGADFVTAESAWDFIGEAISPGSVVAEIAPAPGKDGLYSLKMTFLLKSEASDWLDVRYTPGQPLNWRDEKAISLPYYAEQAGASPWLKITAENNPGANSALHEEQILLDKAPPAPGQWHQLSIPIEHRTPAQKERVTSLNAFLPTRGGLMTPGQPMVFYFGLFKYQPPARPAWPPQVQQKLGFQTLWQGPLDDNSWTRVSDHNNQNDHPAQFINGAAEFVSAADGWNEFLWSNPDKIVLKPNTTYRLQFRYAITHNLAGANARFYSLVRAAETIRADVGWQNWFDAKGSENSRLISFTTQDKTGYRLVFGIRDRGGIRLSDIALYEMTTTP